MILNCIPNICGNEWKYLQESLDENWVSAAGPFIGRFERAIADFVGAEYAVALNSGTAALHLALIVSGVEADDEVLVPSLTFVATANAIKYCNAHPVFMDVEPVSWGMDPQKLADFLKNECQQKNGRLVNRSTGRRIGAILPVDLYGHPTDMQPIIKLAQRWEIPLVEDGSEALGATYKGNPIGSLDKICALSFNGNKIITTGGGGMLVTNEARVEEKIRYLSAQARDDRIQYIHKSIGYNYRMPGLNAAFGLAQAEQLPGFIERKRFVQEQYRTNLADVPGVEIFQEASWARSTYWMINLLLDPEVYPQGAVHLLDYFAENGIQPRPLWQPLHQQPIFANDQSYHISVSNEIYNKGLCLPCSTSITEDELQVVITTIKNYANEFLQ